MDNKTAIKIEGLASNIASCARAWRASVDEKENFENKMVEYFNALEEAITEGV